MTELDLLKDTQDMLSKAIKEGWATNRFEKEAGSLFQKKGWTGKKEVTNPKTGEKETVELGTPRRIKQIFNCNMRSAYSVGRYKSQLENVDVAPYLMYSSVLDNRTRPEHQALNGKVFRYDDPFWQSMYPPNGWNCRCRAVQLTGGDVKRQNLKVETSGDNLHETTVVVGGEEQPIMAYNFNAEGKHFTMIPDAGWGTNLGTEAWNLDVLAYKKVENLEQGLKDNFISQMAANPYRKSVVENITKKIIDNNFKLTRPENSTITWLSPKIIDYLSKKNIKPITPIITFEDRQVKHSLSNRKFEKQRLTEKQFSKLFEYLNGNYDSLYYDSEQLAIIFVKNLPKDEIIDGRDCIKIPVILNCTRNDRPINYIGTTARIENRILKTDKRYKKIE